jgi:hypothetical protein
LTIVFLFDLTGDFTMTPRFHTALGLATALWAFSTGGAAHAQSVYAGAGLFGVQLGYAHAISPSVNLRADYMTLGSRSESANESGTQYQAQVQWNRKALLADWFPFESSTFRLTGGATFNKVAFDLKAGGAGTSVDINNKKYTLGANDTMNIQIKMPNTTPYVGIGWGHKPSNTGWGFHFDLGASVGQFTVTETRTGELVNGGNLGVTQAEVDKELVDVRDSVGQVKFLPQVTLGVSYRF